ncbi:CidA/LrgA family protein [Pleomorphomonas sp. PLEO]|jgi:holin-like protein|uniref:CidA/LrgA family protein n=1 Tax=Pleomorphomonas sp. PLEO TaxID=3239306 RepID=UPI00351E3AF5
MIVGLAVVLLCQLIGEIFAYTTHLPLPAPVVGLVLLFGFFVVRDRWEWLPFSLRSEEIDKTCETLVQQMALLFVPAGVGIVQRLGILQANILGVLAIIVVTTAVSITVTAFTFRFVSRWFPAPMENQE